MSANEKIDILIVDDLQENLLALEQLLQASCLNIVKATSANEALGILMKKDFALVLLDVNMPEMDGFEMAQHMKRLKKTKHIPIIFITAMDHDQQNVFKGYEAGAIDFLYKPINPYVLSCKVDIFCNLYRQKFLIQQMNDTLESKFKQFENNKQVFIDFRKMALELKEQSQQEKRYI